MIIFYFFDFFLNNYFNDYYFINYEIKKKRNNKDDMVSQGFEDDYEDPKEAQLKETKRRIEEAKKPFNPMDFLSTKI